VPTIRQRVITRIYGEGFGAMIAASVTDRAITHLRHAVRHDPELIDVSKLVPGESYVISTRPAPSRKERKLEQEAVAAHRKLDKALRPSRSTRRLERKLGASVLQAQQAESGSRRWTQAMVRVQIQERALERRLQPSAKARRLSAELDTVNTSLERRRMAALTKARKKARPPRTRVFR